jgi:hypothetical protein
MAKATTKTQTKTKTKLKIMLSDKEACALKLLLEGVIKDYDDETGEAELSPLHDALDKIHFALIEAKVRVDECFDDGFRWDETGLLVAKAGATATRSAS